MTPESLKGKVVEVLHARFHVIRAMNLDGEEWSLVGYWLVGNEEPEMPHIQHVMCSPAFIQLTDEPSAPASSKSSAS